MHLTLQTQSSHYHFQNHHPIEHYQIQLPATRSLIILVPDAPIDPIWRILPRDIVEKGAVSAIPNEFDRRRDVGGLYTNDFQPVASGSLAFIQRRWSFKRAVRDNPK